MIDTTYNNSMKLKNYVKLDGYWYRSSCDNCGTYLKGIHAKLCKPCWKQSIKGQVRVVHNKPHTTATKELIAKKKSKDVLTYAGIHNWLWREHIKVKKCQNLDCEGLSNHYDWANITGVYTKDINHYRVLCRVCHKRFDLGKIKLRLEAGL